jgi:hypothetical protein
MRITEIMFEAIFGVSVGVCVSPVGYADDDEGYLIIDMFIFRLIVVYE